MEHYPGRVFIAVGPSKKNPKINHCQAVRIYDGEYQWFKMWRDVCYETGQDHWFTPETYLSIKDFYRGVRAWQY